MSYEIKSMRGKVGLSTAADPLVFETGLQVSEMALLNFIFTIDAVSAGINVGNPATFLCEHSWNGGVTWSTIPNMILEDITAAGIYRSYVSNATGLIAPNVRVSIVCPANEEVVIGWARRTHISPRDSVFLQPPLISGGIASEATLAAILADTNALVTVDYATSAKQDDVLVALALLATEATAAAILADTGVLAAVDFATEASLAAIGVLLAVGIDAPISTRATEVTAAAILADTAALVLKDFATQTTLAAIKLDTAPLTSVQPPAYKDYSSDNLDNVTWETLVVLTANVRELEIFDSSGELVDVSTDGGVTTRFTITPGGNERVPEVIATGTTISVRSRSSALINNGILLMNLRG